MRQLRALPAPEFRRRQHRIHFKIDEVAPVRDPLIKQPARRRLHDLEADTSLAIEPTALIRDPLGHHASSQSKALPRRLEIPALEPLDDHVQHASRVYPAH